MFTKKSLSKFFSLMLAILMTFTAVGNSFTYAESVGSSTNTEVATFDDEVYLYVRDDSRETLKITNLNTNDEYFVFKANDGIYLKNNNGNISKVASIEKTIPILPFGIGINSDWIEFGPDRYDFDLEGVVLFGVACGIIAAGLGCGVRSVEVAIAGATGVSIFVGVYAYKWGRYRFYSSSGIEGEYWSQLYQPTGKKFGLEMYWKGKR